VADSEPTLEQQECVNKAKALFRAADEARRFASGGKRGQELSEVCSVAATAEVFDSLAGGAIALRESGQTTSGRKATTLSAEQILPQVARALLALGRPDLADALASRALAENELSADTHSVVASILDARGEWQSSLGHLRRAHALLPNAPQVRLNLALSLL